MEFCPSTNLLRSTLSATTAAILIAKAIRSTLPDIALAR
jgi:hypothetical protein